MDAHRIGRYEGTVLCTNDAGYQLAVSLSMEQHD